MQEKKQVRIDPRNDIEPANCMFWQGPVKNLVPGPEIVSRRPWVKVIYNITATQLSHCDITATT